MFAKVSKSSEWGKKTLFEWTILCRCSGVVFPMSMLCAVPNAVIAGVLQRVWPNGSMSLFGEDGGILTETIVWSGFTFLLGFLVVFRTSQSYARWWEGCSACHYMRAEWFDAFVTLTTFAQHGSAPQSEVKYFKQLLIRLASLLHATALAELENEGAATEGRSSDKLFYTYDLISPDDLDEESLECLRQSETKVELVYSWILHHIMDGIEKGVLTTPPPLLTRAFQELGSGLVHYHNAVKLALSPFPLAYAQTCDGLLLMHWIIVPVVTSQWATHAVWAALFSFIQVFVLSLLNSIAAELANPFGPDANDVDGAAMQVDMNVLLCSLMTVGCSRAPTMLGGWGEVIEESDCADFRNKSLTTVFHGDGDLPMSASAPAPPKRVASRRGTRRRTRSLSSSSSGPLRRILGGGRTWSKARQAAPGAEPRDDVEAMRDSESVEVGAIRSQPHEAQLEARSRGGVSGRARDIHVTCAVAPASSARE